MTEEKIPLEKLVMDQDLEELENLLDEFNIFEVLGAVRVELRHSEFLAYLMNPQQSHGLGDNFVKKFLQKIIVGIDQPDLAVSAIDIDIWGLNEIEVQREWNNIDILLLSEENQFAVVIENKIYSNEHSGQLERYRKIVRKQFPDWKILFLYLTPEGEDPSDASYLPVSYDLVSEIIDNLLISRKSSLGPDVYTMMSHYTAMLRRQILGNSDTQELARKIYKRHQRAFDFIFENKPDLQNDLSDLLAQIINEFSEVNLDYQSKLHVGFSVPEWDLPKLLESEGWTKSKRLILFEFANGKDQLRIKLYIGPGPETTRQKLLDIALDNGNVFKSQYKNLNKKWNDIYTYNILSKNDYHEAIIDDLEEKIRTKWNEFIKKDFIELKKLINSKNWD